MHNLKEASPYEIQKLLPHMKTYLPDSMAMYGSLDMYANYKMFDGFDTKFYVSTNKNQLHSLVVMYPFYHAVDNQGSQAFNIFWDVNAESDEDVISCLRSLPNFDWSKKYLIISTFSILEKLKYLSKRLSGDKVEIDYKLVTNGCIYERDMPDFKLPPGFRLGTLHPKHVPYVNSTFGNPIGHSDEFMSAEFKLLPTSAVYKTTTHENDETSGLPVSYSTVRHIGEIGRLFTLPEYRGLGMAKVVIQDLVKKLTKKGSLPYLGASVSNTVAVRSYEKLGFVEKFKFAIAAFEQIDR